MTGVRRVVGRPASKLGYVVLMGLLFAFLQTGYFFQLQFRLTAAYPTFLTITLAWLLGSVAGLWAGGREGRGEGEAGRLAWLAASLASYYGVLVLLRRFPYQIEWLPAVGALIAVSGAQAGHFFAVNRALLDSSSRLFFWENNGFVLGWIGGWAGYVQFGNAFHWAAPVLTGLLAGGLWRRVAAGGDE